MAYKGKYQIKNPEKYSGNSSNIIYRSLWEKDFMKYLDESVSIEKWASEETFVRYYNPVDKKMHRYFPDFLVRMKNKHGETKVYMIEIKPARQCVEPVKKSKVTRRYVREFLTWKVNMAKFEAARKHCKDNGILFEILTEKELGKILKWRKNKKA